MSGQCWIEVRILGPGPDGSAGRTLERRTVREGLSVEEAEGLLDLMAPRDVELPDGLRHIGGSDVDMFGEPIWWYAETAELRSMKIRIPHALTAEHAHSIAAEFAVRTGRGDWRLGAALPLNDVWVVGLVDPDPTKQCAHGCGETVRYGDYCDECDRDACLVGPDGICGKGNNAREEIS